MQSLGLLHRPDLISPVLYSGSVLNLGLLMGAFAAALLGREFAIRVAPLGELLKGGVGGLLMGLGANLAFGCNIGGFFSAVAALSLSGVAMMLGLGIGSYLGLRYLLWELERLPGLSTGKSYTCCAPRSSGPGWQPVLGILTLLMLLPLPFWYSRLGYARTGGISAFWGGFWYAFPALALLSGARFS